MCLAVVEDMSPKVEIHDQLLEAPGLNTLTHLGKSLGLHPNKFMGVLRNEKFIDKDNIAYQRYRDQGIFDLKERPYYHKITREMIGVRLQTYVTPKGIIYFQKLINDKKLYVEDIRV